MYKNASVLGDLWVGGCTLQHWELVQSFFIAVWLQSTWKIRLDSLCDIKYFWLNKQQLQLKLEKKILSDELIII